MNRDKNKDTDYFKRYIEILDTNLKNLVLSIDNNKVSQDRIPILLRSIGGLKLRLLIAKYSAGIHITEIKQDFVQLLHHYSDYWIEGNVLMKYDGRYLKQYLDYDDMLWMLSLGILFKVPLIDFQVLIELIRRDEVVDVVYEYLISFKTNTDFLQVDESYKYGIDHYKSLREFLNSDNKELNSGLMEQALTIDWKKDHKEMLSLKNSRHDTYFGAWSFESAAIVVILNLDDSKYRHIPYYPKDLVDYYKISL